MSKNLAVKLAESLVRTLKKHSPAIFTGIAVAGTVGAVALAVNATPKAERLIEQKKKELGVDKLTPVETVKTVWKPFVPTAAVCLTSAACGIASNAISAKRGAMLGAALTLSETALMDYKRKAIEVVGESGEKAIRDAVAEEKIKQNPVVQEKVIVTNKGDTLCYDPLIDRYFTSSREQIKKAEYEFNRDLLYENIMSLNDLYTMLDLPNVGLGDVLGWNNFGGNGMKISFSSQLDEMDRPCLVLGFYPIPRSDYQGR